MEKQEVLINDEYYTGEKWTRENLILVSEHNNNEMDSNIDLTSNNEELKNEIIEKGNVGDSELRKLYETNDWLVLLSIDSGIEVVDCINKKDLTKSENVELYYTA